MRAHWQYSIHFHLCGDDGGDRRDAAHARWPLRWGGSADGFDHIRSLVALALIGKGRARSCNGVRSQRGVALLDDAMLEALSGRLHPVWTGAVYCHLMDACYEIDESAVGPASGSTRCKPMVRRAFPMPGCTGDLSSTPRPGAPHHGVMAGGGARSDRRPAKDMAHIHIGTIAEGHYEIGEIRRLRGDLTGAEEAFRRAHELGRDPQPGLALVRLAQGQPAHTAAASIRTALAVAGLPAATGEALALPRSRSPSRPGTSRRPGRPAPELEQIAAV